MEKEEKINNVIEVENVSVHFPVRRQIGIRSVDEVIRAVDGVTLSVREGEILAVAGESGCGKTTLGKAILNVIKPTHGKVRYRGIDLAELPGGEMRRLRRKIQLIFQDPYESLDSRQSVYKTLLEPLTIHRKDLKEAEKRALIYKTLEDVGLLPAESIAARFPHHLSGGQRQRLSIAATMILEPDFVVADEPVSMLDVSIRAEILKLMLDLKGGRELTYLFITHDLSLAWMIADRIAVFYLGKMVEIGPADDVVHRCVHPYTQALVSVIPAMDDEQKKSEKRVLEGETPSPAAIPKGCRFHTRCRYYQQNGMPEICREKEPVLHDVGEDHMAACHFT